MPVWGKLQALAIAHVLADTKWDTYHMKKGGAEFIQLLEEDLDLHHLSQHPFYQLWNHGKLSRAALRDYAKQYYHFVAYFPRLVSQIHANTPELARRLEILENLSEEENKKNPHEDMWVAFAEGIGVSRQALSRTKLLPETRKAIQTMKKFCQADFLQGAAAVLAYEAQISDIAELKKRGLKKFYKVTKKSALEFFEVHGQVDIEHQKTWKRLLAKDAKTASQQQAARRALKQSLASLWGLLDGVYNLHYQS